MSADIDSPFVPLGHISPRGSLESSLATAKADTAAAAGFLRRHRVVGLGLSRLVPVVPDGAEAGELTAVRERRALLDGRLDHWHDVLSKAVDEVETAVADIKGGAARPLYRDRLWRDLGDIDVMVSDVDDAWRLARQLRCAGFEYTPFELPWVKRDPSDGRLYGQVQVARVEAEPMLRIDIHFGGYSLRHCRRMDCGPVAEGHHRLDPFENLPCFIGNAAGDYLIKLKDVNDTVLMLESSTVEDWQPGLEMVDRHGLAGFWNALLGIVRATSTLSDNASATLDDLVRRGVRAEKVPFGVPDHRVRLAATVRDAFVWGRDTHGWVHGMTAALKTYQLYRRPVSLVCAPCRHDDMRMLRDMDTESCVRLVPQTVADSMLLSTATAPPRLTAAQPLPGSSVLKTIAAEDGQHAWITAADDVLVPTVSYRLCRKQAGAFHG